MHCIERRRDTIGGPKPMDVDNHEADSTQPYPTWWGSAEYTEQGALLPKRRCERCGGRRAALPPAPRTDPVEVGSGGPARHTITGNRLASALFWVAGTSRMSQLARRPQGSCESDAAEISARGTRDIREVFPPARHAASRSAAGAAHGKAPALGRPRSPTQPP